MCHVISDAEMQKQASEVCPEGTGSDQLDIARKALIRDAFADYPVRLRKVARVTCDEKTMHYSVTGVTENGRREPVVRIRVMPQVAVFLIENLRRPAYDYGFQMHNGVAVNCVILVPR